MYTEAGESSERPEDDFLLGGGGDGDGGEDLSSPSAIVRLARQCRDFSAQAQRERYKREKAEAEVAALRARARLGAKERREKGRFGWRERGGGHGEDDHDTGDVQGQGGKDLLEVKRLRLKVQQQGQRIEDLRQELREAQDECRRWKDEAFQNDFEGSANQGGNRHQEELSLLRNRVRELERANGSLRRSAKGTLIPLPSSAGGAPRSTIPRVDVNVRAREGIKAMESQFAVDQLTEEHKVMTAESESLRMRLNSSKARARMLEAENSKLRKGMKTVLEKTEADNELIERLRIELGRLPAKT